MKDLTPADLKSMFDTKEDFQLIDVREPYEHETANIGGELIPMGQILGEHERIQKDKKVVVYCRSGNRSAVIINELEKRFGFENLYNLKGGILAYGREVDPSVLM
jgi:rhodanese-related sulfurtransferase